VLALQIQADTAGTHIVERRVEGARTWLTRAGICTLCALMRNGRCAHARPPLKGPADNVYRVVFIPETTLSMSSWNLWTDPIAVQYEVLGGSTVCYNQYLVR
jgi:hypothetical protein